MADKPMRGRDHDRSEKVYRLKAGAPPHYLDGDVRTEWQGRLPVGVKPGAWMEEVEPKGKAKDAPPSGGTF